MTVVLPALNEEESLRSLLPALRRSLSDLGVSHEVLLVDGGSSDDTAALAVRERVEVLDQESPGFGPAVRAGLSRARGEWILLMDADGSHSPEDIGGLWAARDGFDLVIASRYVPGGSAAMPFYRLALSRFLNAATRALFRLDVSDASSGFRLYRAGAVRSLKLLAPDGSIQQEILLGLLRSGARVREVPFSYRPRVGGRSKAAILRMGVSYLKLFLLLM